MYDPATARFLSKDPLEEAGGSSNFYLYCGNDPVNRTDPSGLGPRVPKWFEGLSQEEGGKRVVTWRRWYTTFGKSDAAALLWEWLGGQSDDFVTEDRIRKIIADDPAHNPSAQVAVYTAEGAYRRGPADIAKYLAGIKTDDGRRIDIQKYGQHPQLVANDYEKHKRIFWVLEELDEDEGREPEPPAEVAPARPAVGAGQAMSNPFLGPRPVPDTNKVKPFEFDYHFSDPGFVKLVDPHALVQFDAEKENNAELIWTGQLAFLTAKGAKVAQNLADVMSVIGNRYVNLQLRVPDLEKRYPAEAKELTEIYRTMTLAYLGRSPRAGLSVAFAGGRTMAQACDAAPACAPFHSNYLFSDEIDRLGERAYYLLRRMTGQVLDKAVGEMTPWERFQTIWGMAVQSGRLNAAFQKQVESILTDPAFYTVAAGYAALHAVGVGEVLDLGFLAVLFAKLGIDSIKIAGRVAVIADTLKNGRTDINMDYAAGMFVEISLIAAGDAVASVGSFRTFRSLREELAAIRGGSGPVTPGQPPGVGTGGPPSAVGPQPSPSYTLPSWGASKPQGGTFPGYEPPPLAALAKDKPLEIPNRKYPDICPLPKSNSVSPAPMLPSPVPWVAIPVVITQTLPQPQLQPQPEPRPQPPTASDDEDQKDECRTLTGLVAGEKLLQTKFITERRPVKRDLEQSGAGHLLTYNGNNTDVFAPVDVYYRIDPKGKPIAKVPGGNDDTHADRVVDYIAVVGRAGIPARRGTNRTTDPQESKAPHLATCL